LAAVGDMSDARDAAVREALSDLEAALPGASAALVLRSGALFGGRAPSAVNREVYAAMVAAMAGAAEAATADLGAEVQWVEARLKQGALVTAPIGKKLVLVVHVAEDAGPSVSTKLLDAAKRLAVLF